MITDRDGGDGGGDISTADIRESGADAWGCGYWLMAPSLLHNDALYDGFDLIGGDIPRLLHGPLIAALRDRGGLHRLIVNAIQRGDNLRHIRECVACAAPCAVLHVVCARHKKAASVTDDLRPAAPVQCDGRNAAGHRLEQRHSESLPVAH